MFYPIKVSKIEEMIDSIINLTQSDKAVIKKLQQLKIVLNYNVIVPKNWQWLGGTLGIGEMPDNIKKELDVTDKMRMILIFKEENALKNKKRKR